MISDRKRQVTGLVLFVAVSLIFVTLRGNIASGKIQNSDILKQSVALSNIDFYPTATQPSHYTPKTEPEQIARPSQPVPEQVIVQFKPETTRKSTKLKLYHWQDDNRYNRFKKSGSSGLKNNQIFMGILL